MAYVETLTSADLDFGRDLWQMLRRERKFPLQGMFWFFDEQAEDWHLVIATPLVDKAGPKRSYLDLDEFNQEEDGSKRCPTLEDNSD
jgi:hypothetical protein